MLRCGAHLIVTTRDRLDCIVNHACQTVRRVPELYAHSTSWGKFLKDDRETDW